METVNKKFQCPVCGYPGLYDSPRTEGCGGSYEICPSCGFQFGVTDEDEGLTYVDWRQKWIEGGMRWSSPFVGPASLGGMSMEEWMASGFPFDSRGEPPPLHWNPQEQLRSLTENGDSEKPV